MGEDAAGHAAQQQAADAALAVRRHRDGVALSLARARQDPAPGRRVVNGLQCAAYARRLRLALDRGERPVRRFLAEFPVFLHGRSGEDYAHLAAGRAHFGDFDPYGDFDLIFGAAKLNLRILEIPVRYRERTYGAPNISRFADGWLLLRMSALAAGRLFFAV